MADGVYTAAKRKLMGTGTQIDFDNGGDTFYVALGMSNATADAAAQLIATSNSVVSNLSIDEFDGANYTRQSISAQTVSFTSNSAYFDGGNVTFSQVGVGTRSIDIVLLMKATGTAVADDTTNVPVAVWDVTDLNANGGDVEVAWNSNGILTLA